MLVLTSEKQSRRPVCFHLQPGFVYTVSLKAEKGSGTLSGGQRQKHVTGERTEK